MKSRIAIGLGLLVLAVLLPLLYFFSSVPRDQIDTLENGFVQTKLVNGKASYEIVKKRPSQWKNLKQISKHAKNAIMVSEDWAFYQHEGVDSAQVRKAISDHLTKGEKLRGASTISQQLVKNLFLTNERSLNRKLKEYFITKYLESKLSKDKIFEVYLNVIQYGDELYGIENASKFYFKKSAGSLNAKEGAFLAMLLPNPKKYSQSFKDRSLSDYADKTMQEILLKMRQAKFLDEGQWKKASELGLNWIAKKKRSARKSGRSKGLSDGSEYEAGYMSDSDLSVKELKYDDDAMVEDLSGLDTEFQVDTE